MAAYIKNSAQKRMSLMDLAKLEWRKEFQYDLPVTPWGLRVMNEQLYCCHSEGIAIYDSRLRPVSSISNGEMGAVNDVASFSGTELIVAADKGLFHIKHDGSKLHTIDTGLFVSLSENDGLIYAAELHTGSIRAYEHTSSWQKGHSFKPTCDKSEEKHYITLSVRDNMIVSACYADHKLRCWSLTGGPFYTIGKKGTDAGMFENPRLCGIDDDCIMLVADVNNHRLQAVNPQEKSLVFKLKSEIENPKRAVVFYEKLVVISQKPNLLTVFTHE